MTGILIRRGNLDREAHVEGRLCEETQGEDGEREAWTDPSLTALRRNLPYQHYKFRL